MIAKAIVVDYYENMSRLELDNILKTLSISIPATNKRLWPLTRPRLVDRFSPTAITKPEPIQKSEPLLTAMIILKKWKLQKSEQYHKKPGINGMTG